MNVLEIVAAYRCCRTCGEWKPIGSFCRTGNGRVKKVCNACGRPDGNPPYRTLQITDKGRAYLRELEAA